jgi:hypothetical protein
LRSNWILRPKPFIPKLPPPKTGIKNPKCYAAELADCSEKISGEHYISHSILRALSDDGVHIDVEGLSWLKGEKKKLPAGRLISNILFKRHNEALSGFDNISKMIFLNIQRIDKEYAADINENVDRVFLFNGHDIERWALKTLCGSVFSGSTSHLTVATGDWKPSRKWLRVLFGLESFPIKWGLYVSVNVDEMNEVERGYGFSPISNKSLGVYGSITNLNRKKFVLAMADTPADKTDTILAGYIYRPEELVTTNGKSKKVIRFGWDVRGQGGSITVNLE